MGRLFEELDYCPTPIGALSLRRRRELRLGVDVYEIMLGQKFLMTSLFTASEVALTRHLKPRGIFGLWSNERTDRRFLDRLGEAFAEAWAEPVTIDTPLTGRPSTRTVYLARAATG